MNESHFSEKGFFFYRQKQNGRPETKTPGHEKHSPAEGLGMDWMFGHFTFITRILVSCGEALPFAPLNTSLAVPSAAIASAGIAMVLSTL